MNHPILFNRLGSDLQITTGVLGMSGTAIGSPSYAACRFGTGVYTPSGKYAKFAVGTFFNRSKFTICLWTKYPDYTVVSGDPQAPPTSSFPNLIDIVKDGVNSVPYIKFLHNATSNVTSISLVYSDSTMFQVNITAGLDIAINDVVFYAIIYDATLVGANILQVYYYNYTSGQTGTFNATTTTAVKAMTLPADTTMSVGGTTLFARPFSGICECIKVFETAETDFNFKNYERSGCNDQIIM